LNFTIQHPLNWKVDNSLPLSERVTFRISGSDDSIFGSFFIVGVDEPESYLDTETMTLKNTSPQQRAQQRLDSVSSYNPNLPSRDVKLIRQNEVTVGGYSGWKIEFIIYNSQKEMSTRETYDQYHSEIFTAANGKPYWLAYIEDTLKVPETLPLVNKMVESFQIKRE
jgi:hypothetical protein